VPLLEQVLGQYPKDVRILFKNYPLPNHKFALPAAIAAFAAHRQGKFWPYHDKVFKDFNNLSEEKLHAIAVAVGLDLRAFDAARKDPAIRALIERDVREGNAAGVRGTPTVYINGKVLKNRSLDGFRAMIDRELRRTSARAK
jgi:protein-disulfide isomerase